MGSLDRRIQDLEGALSPHVCPVCRQGPQVPYEIVFGDDEDDYLDDEPEEPEFCDGCGRQLNITIFFDDSPFTMPAKLREEQDGDQAGE